jgi:hypothetical protein
MRDEREGEGEKEEGEGEGEGDRENAHFLLPFPAFFFLGVQKRKEAIGKSEFHTGLRLEK